MGIRGFIKGILSIILTVQVIRIWLFGGQITPDIGWVAVILLILAIWYMLDSFGILARFG